MKGGMITSINELDLNDITFEKMHWEYGTLMSRSVGKRSEKQTYYTKGVKTSVVPIIANYPAILFGYWSENFRFASAGT